VGEVDDDEALAVGPDVEAAVGRGEPVVDGRDPDPEGVFDDGRRDLEVIPVEPGGEEERQRQRDLPRRRNPLGPPSDAFEELLLLQRHEDAGAGSEVVEEEHLRIEVRLHGLVVVEVILGEGEPAGGGERKAEEPTLGQRVGARFEDAEVLAGSEAVEELPEVDEVRGREAEVEERPVAFADAEGPDRDPALPAEFSELQHEVGRRCLAVGSRHRKELQRRERVEEIEELLLEPRPVGFGDDGAVGWPRGVIGVNHQPREACGGDPRGEEPLRGRVGRDLVKEERRFVGVLGAPVDVGHG
jgi:hypothetical protein